MEFEFIKEKIEKPEKGVYMPIVKKWLKTDNKTLVFKLKNAEETKKCYLTLMAYRSHNKHDFTVFKKLGECKVYIVR